MRNFPLWLPIVLVVALDVNAAALPLDHPGADPYDAALTTQIREAWGARDPDYRPRTRHLLEDGGPRYTNRLFLESSPYLLQHAHNPVNWYPWGDEAFETARELNRPVLLSVGYSTCHWCHVMEEESFEDPEIARFLNEHYVVIKVDREERPDIDAIYMQAVQLMTQHGGWPMTVWLTPDREPYYGGTYYPPRDGDRGTQMGFLSLLRALSQAYHEKPDDIAAYAEQITQTIRANLTAGSRERKLPGTQVLVKAGEGYRAGFDPVNGGLQGAPKFPSSLPVRFLLREYRRTGNEEMRRMAELTLERMAGGGIHDQIGGGFHRYSVDEQWLVPHFEKMLYDNALLVMAYLEGWQVTGRDEFAEVARRTLDYALREMRSEEGAFYSATDADSLTPDGHREEGRFFVWTQEEIADVVGKDAASTVNAYYYVTPYGNFEGRTILQTRRDYAAVGEELGVPAKKVQAIIEKAVPLLYDKRSERPAPLRDEKILAAWNGLMISALARAARVLGEQRYADAASETARFLLGTMRDDGYLLRSYRDGRPGPEAFLEDYAFVIAGMLDLFEATGDTQWFEAALELDGILARHYEDESGGYFRTGDRQKALLAREKPAHDGAEPSGNSVQLLNLLRLYEFTTDDNYRERAQRALEAFSYRLELAPHSLSEMLLAVDFHADTAKEIVIVVPGSRDAAQPFLDVLARSFVPNHVLMVAAQDDIEDLGKMLPLLEYKVAKDGEATAYVCRNRICELPTTDPAAFAEQLLH